MITSGRRMLILAEGKFSPLRSKTANGAIAYLPSQVVGVVDSMLAGSTAQKVLGYGGDIPVVKDIQEGLKFLPTHLLIGIAPSGGKLPEAWRGWILEALRAKLHILSGLHTLLKNDPEFVAVAEENDVVIIDYRRIPPEAEMIPKGSWKTRKARVILAVGTDCNIGKMTTMIEVHKVFLERGLKADFVATGQTGMLIRGRGICVDSIISDYTAGCTEREVDQSAAEGYDYIFVEGQGALTHQGYSGVTLGLLHGSMPDAILLCHQPTRLKDDYGQPLPTLPDAVRQHEEALRHFKRTKVVGIGLNSIGLSDAESQAVAKKITAETGLPAVDAFRFGGTPLADALLNYFDRKGT